ncbi:Glyco-trans-2-like domain-containing protein [Aphelenchoides besseyi]|nr:Glyco-trans-2-like domain-containing protein [Aphelenchoides besseyi]
MFTIPITAELKYAVHVVIFISWIVGFEFFCNSFAFTDTAIDTTSVFDPVERYGTTITLVLYLLRLFSLLVLPQCICNALGLLLFNGFKETVELKNAPIFSPFVCFRVVTRGDYPALIKENLRKNRQTCYEAGIENFMFEVVTDKQLDLELDARVREIVVPTTYRTKTGAKFKARALQFCLEDRVSEVRDEDWVVHLDEETLLTTNSVRGILNFCADGKHQFGQGVITYAHGHILNWLTTLSDSFRVADDMGKLHYQLSIFHKPLFAWKGSFVVTKVEAERKVNWDHGLEGSLAEDCFFSMIAFRDGYSFDFIDGEMHEKSPFTIWDFLQQRKRWLQGIFLTVHSKAIPMRYKLFLGLSLYAWITMPFTSLQVVLCAIAPLPKYPLIDILVAFIAAVNIYMYLYGTVKSLWFQCRQNVWRLVFYVIGALLCVPFNIAIENVAVLLGIFGRKDEFYIVKKDLTIIDV